MKFNQKQILTVQFLFNKRVQDTETIVSPFSDILAQPDGTSQNEQ